MAAAKRPHANVGAPFEMHCTSPIARDNTAVENGVQRHHGDRPVRIALCPKATAKCPQTGARSPRRSVGSPQRQAVAMGPNFGARGGTPRKHDAPGSSGRDSPDSPMGKRGRKIRCTLRATRKYQDQITALRGGVSLKNEAVPSTRPAARDFAGRVPRQSPRNAAN